MDVCRDDEEFAYCRSLFAIAFVAFVVGTSKSCASCSCCCCWI